MLFESIYRRGVCRVSSSLLGVLVLPFATSSAFAQVETSEDEEIDEVVVTGSQIKGARISDALAVSVISADDIAATGFESGDELLDSIPEMGQNFFSESDTAGGVNAARGDVGAINMRNLGTGNTLVLLNGRRLVNMATYQTEWVGGSLVPVNSPNSNHLPVFGVDRIEILRDGASAIYGADAVAGVVNTVLKDDFEGLTIRTRFNEYEGLPRNDEALSVEWGRAFNGGATHVGVFARHYKRDRVNSKDDPRWENSDFRWRFDENSPWATSTRFRNDSTNAAWGRFDVIPGLGSTHSLRAEDFTDTSGEFELFPAGHASCAGTYYDLGNGNCSREDSTARGVRYNTNGEGFGRDLLSELERTTVYGYLNHEMDSGLELFGDFYFYDSMTNRYRDPNVDLSAAPLRVGASNYHNPLGPVGSPSRLVDEFGAPLPFYVDVPDEGLELNMDLYRFTEYPMIVDNDGQAQRILFGLRGTVGDWDWESAATWSEATRDDITHNRLSNTLITEALFDPTSAAYNPFSAGVSSNIERALIDVYRKGRTTLSMFDVKFSNAELFEMPAGPVGFVAGYELRRETYEDDRDPRLDGTINFMRDPDLDGVFDVEGDFEGDTYPFTSDVVRSSPTPDGKGDRLTHSVFAELQIPLHETLDVQVAGRFEDFDDIGDTTVGKVAFGWRPWERALFRGSWSTAFRAPNLITINESFVARSNELNDYVCFFGEDQGTLAEDCDYGIQRQASGSKDLVPEESTNTSIGVVLELDDGFTATVDFWRIEKNDTIGLFGEENHILYDLVLRSQAGTSNCASVQGNPDVVRRDFDPQDQDLIDGYMAAGLCPVGSVDYVSDIYTNLDTRTLKGFDVGLYYDVSTSIGDFYLKYNGAFYQEFEQTATGALSSAVLEGKAANPDIVYPLIGLGDLLGIDGNQKSRHSASVVWDRNNWAASVTGTRISSFHQILANGDAFYIPSMTTYNAKIDYGFDVADVNMRLRLGINNVSDERAPISDSSYGFFQDAHRDWGRNYYLDLRLSF